MSKRVLLLGPYAGNRNISIVNYFNFYRLGLREKVTSVVPGSLLAFDSTAPVLNGRFKAWAENYAVWPVRMRTLQGDLFHIVDQGLGWYARFLRDGKRVITVHDLIAYLSCAGKLDVTPPPNRRKFLVRECARQIVRMDHVICVSQTTADLLCVELGFPASRVTVIHHHVDPAFQPLEEAERLKTRKRLFGNAEHVVIHVGKASVYKNRIGALRAFARLYERLPEARMFLVHGQPDREEADFLAESKCEEFVQFCPPATQEELRQFYGAADVLIFPSLYEGFGWPPLEAMACGCPVVCSDRASLKEVVGDAALTVSNPHNHGLLAEKMYEVLRSSENSRELRNRGFERVKQFTPEKALGAVASVYEQLLKQ